MAKGASLLPSDFAAGGALPDGDYHISASVAATFNYGGKGPDTPSIHITYVDADGEAREQYYSAGKLEFLAPSDDGHRFVHPSGEEARIQQNSNAAAFIGSMVKGGFPLDKLSDDVTVFSGCKVTVRNEAQPKRAGIKDEKEGKTIPLVTKVLSMGGAKAASGAGQKTAASNGSGNLDEAARTAVLEALAEAPDNKLTRTKLGTSVMLRLSKAKDPQMAAVKKLASDAVWLAAQAEAGGWTTDGENVSIG